MVIESRRRNKLEMPWGENRKPFNILLQAAPPSNFKRNNWNSLKNKPCIMSYNEKNEERRKTTPKK